MEDLPESGESVPHIRSDNGKTSTSDPQEALARYGRPKIFNTDQGSQFTSAAFTGLLLENAIAVSMDGRGAWLSLLHLLQYKTAAFKS